MMRKFLKGIIIVIAMPLILIYALAMLVTMMRVSIKRERTKGYNDGYIYKR